MADERIIQILDLPQAFEKTCQELYIAAEFEGTQDSRSSGGWYSLEKGEEV